MGVTNLLSGAVIARDGGGIAIRVGATEFPAVGSACDPGREIIFSLRPEALRLVERGATPPSGWAEFAAEISRIEFLGALTRLEVRLPDAQLLRVALLDQRLDSLRVGGVATLAYDPRRLTIYQPS